VFGYGAQDFLKIVFNVPTNTPKVSTKADIDLVFRFSAALGDNYTGAWLDPQTAVITIVDPSNSATETALMPGTLSVSVLSSAGLRSADRSSSAYTSSATVSGYWYPPPPIVSFQASNTGNNHRLVGKRGPQLERKFYSA
jgi:hypothetical protein